LLESRLLGVVVAKPVPVECEASRFEQSPPLPKWGKAVPSGWECDTVCQSKIVVNVIYKLHLYNKS